MQQQQVETTVNCVGHTQLAVEDRFSRLRHDHAIDGLNGTAQGPAGFAELVEWPKHCWFHPREGIVAIKRTAGYAKAAPDARGPIRG
jgi:hypothetical protein